MSNTKHPVGHVLQAYHDGELDASAAAAVADHCEHCAACSAELAELEQLGQLLASTPTPELSRTVWHRVRPGRVRRSRLRPALAFAACAAGVIVGILLGPIRFDAQVTGTELAWSETATVWNNDATSSLLTVYQSGQE